ncbi:MAG TPA: hypothetical protein VKT78_02480 [Fimbriimonadaceae bacterium]|nr:hypothetical protein [Fimbriimonadaceae bacterium]
MKSVATWLTALVAFVGFFLLARSTNLFVEHNARVLYALFVAAFLVPGGIAFASPKLPWRWAIPVTLGVLLGDIAAIRRDLAKDPTSHVNPGPELVMLALVITICALAGAFTGGHVRRNGIMPSPSKKARRT